MEIKLGNKIRDIRKRKKLTMKQLAEMVGVSLLTIQRIETGKTSPSVALLSEIAHQLEHPISHFMPEEFGMFKHVKADAIPAVESSKMNLSLLVPKGLINEHISISLGKAKRGKCIEKHHHEGCEITYIIRGKCIFEHGRSNYELNEGDLIYFSGKIPHSVTALEPLEFFSVFVRDRESLT